MVAGRIEVTNRIPGFIEQSRAAHQANLQRALMLWRNAIVQLLAGPRSGRMYRVPGTNRMYQASAPGEPPAVRLGDLRASIGWTIQGNAGLVGTNLVYGLWLERGTRNMAPRPFIGPGYKMMRHEIRAAFTSRWDRQINVGTMSLRSMVYMAGRLLGDLSAISPGLGVSGVRSGLYFAGRAMGDYSAITGGGMGSRGLNRLVGRHTQRSMGMGGGRLGRRAIGRAAGAGISRYTP